MRVLPLSAFHPLLICAIAPRAGCPYLSGAPHDAAYYSCRSAATTAAHESASVAGPETCHARKTTQVSATCVFQSMFIEHLGPVGIGMSCPPWSPWFMLGGLRGEKVKGNERREVYSVDDGRKGGVRFR